jgi:polyferredoxin
MNRRQSLRAGLLFVSFFLAPATFYYVSPLVPTVGAFQGVVTGAVLLFGLQFLSALVLGRAWCGWVCPAGGLQESCFRARDRRVAGGRWNRLKFFIWVPWLATVVFALARSGLKGVDPFFMTTFGLSGASLPGMIAYVGLIGTRVCPMSLEVQPMVERGSIRSSECINCGACADSCPNRAIRFAFGCEK